MKQFTKICLIISLVCLSIGAVCLGAGVAFGSGLREVWAMAGNGELNVGPLHIGGWHTPYFMESDDLEYVKPESGTIQKHFPADNVKNLKIDMNYGTVCLTDSETDQIEIAVDAPGSNSYKCDCENDTLMLVDSTRGWTFWKNGFGRKEVTVEIAIPKGKQFDEVLLATDAGRIEISYFLTTEDLDVELGAGELTAGKITAADVISADVGAGNLEIEEFTAETLDIDCGFGRAQLRGSVLEGADVDAGMGEIELWLAGREDDFDYDITCGLGAVNINGAVYSTLSADKKIDNHTGREISLDCGVGEIELIVEEEL